MKLVVNGEPAELAQSRTLSGFLVERKVKMPDMVTVELNGEIIRREAFPATLLRENDRIELLYFMGGGSDAAPVAVAGRRAGP